MIRLYTKFLQHADHYSTIYYTITDHFKNDIYISEDYPINFNYIDFSTSYKDDFESEVDIPIDFFINNYINFYSNTDNKNAFIASFVFNKIEHHNNKNYQLILQKNETTYSFIKVNSQHKKSYSFNDLIDINNLLTKDIFDIFNDIKTLKASINNHKYHALYKYIYLDEITTPKPRKAIDNIKTENEQLLLLSTKYELKSPTSTQLHEDHNALVKKRKQKLIKINEHLKALLQLGTLEPPEKIVNVIDSLKDEELMKFNCNISNYLLYMKIISQVLKIPLFYKNQIFVVKFKSVNSYGIILNNDTGEKLKIIPFYINKDKNIVNIKNFIIGYNWIFEYNQYLCNFLL